MPGSGQPPVPREHGAWGILLVPFLAAVGVAGHWNGAVSLLLVSVLAFYLARSGWLKRQWGWLIGLLGVSLAAALPLVTLWRLWWLPLFALAGALLAARPTGRSLAGQLLGVAGLTLTAPAAWYAATGRLDRTAAALWLVFALYFLGGVFHVRMHLTAARWWKQRAESGPVTRLGWPVVGANLAVHLFATLVGIGLAVAGAVPGLVALLFVLPLGRSVAGAIWWRPPLRIKRLGWTEVAYSLLFGLGVVVGFRAI